MKTLRLVVFGAFPLGAQLLGTHSWYPRHNFAVGVGGAQPRADLAGFFSDSAGLSFGYGYRFQRNFQLDAGVDTVFFAGRVRDFFSTGLGDLRIRDYQLLIPFGGRAILPIDRGRFLVSAGGGGAHMRYLERLRQPGEYFNVDCPVCGSRNGWGYYGLVAASLALERRQHFRLGATARVYQGHTRGDPVGAVPPLRTTDRWVNVFGEFGVSF